MDSGFRLVAEDEFAHAPGPEINFNESVYVNAFDQASGMGGWMRLGNRVNERYAELSVVFYLPDGRIAAQFGRPGIADNCGFDAGGLKFEVVEPMHSLRARYDGPLMLVENPDDLRSPAKLFESAPRLEASIDWKLETVSPLHGGLPLSADQPTMYGRDFSLGHFNQHVRASGHVKIGALEWDFAPGWGWRDHSWGPRWWTNIVWYRLLLCAFPDGRGFMIHKIADDSNRARRSGVLLVDGAYHEIADFDLTVDWTEARDPARLRVTVITEDGLRAVIHGEILSLAPLRNRREENGRSLLSRIAEGHTRFTWDGVVGHGMTEFIERVGKDGGLAGYPL